MPLLILGASCSDEGACGDHPGLPKSLTDDPSYANVNPQNAPDVLDVSLAYQLPSDPWTLILNVDFHDPDGNLNDGQVFFYLSARGQKRAFPMNDLLSFAGLAPNATDGRVAANIRFSDNSSDGAHATLGVRLQDADSLFSNCVAIDMRFQVTDVADL